MKTALPGRARCWSASSSYCSERSAPCADRLDRMRADREPFKMKVILIADDEPSLRLLVRETIGSDRYTVLDAADGDAAWELIQEHHPSIVLLDVSMPGRTGLELARAIKADPALAGTHVVLLSAKAQQLDVADGLAAGGDRYMTKPFSPLELL